MLINDLIKGNKKFREAFGFEGCPIEFVVNKKND
jgi:predicted GTPase